MQCKAQNVDGSRPLYNRHERAKDKEHGTQEPEFTQMRIPSTARHRIWNAQ